MTKPINVLRTIVAASLTGMYGFAVEADDRSNLIAWANEAGKEISSVMQYPRLALSQGKSASTHYIVTINRDGDVLDYSNFDRRVKVFFNSASKRALKRVDFPALPDSYTGDELTFKLSLDYMDSTDSLHDRFRTRANSRGAVTGSRIAFLPTSVPVAAK